MLMKLHLIKLINLKLRNIVVYAMMFLSFSCDFTTSIHKDIIKAQEHLAHQEYQLAVLKYEDILKHNPNAKLKVKLVYQLGEIYFLYLNDGPKALYYFTQVKDLTQDKSWLSRVSEKKAEIYFTMIKDYGQAATEYTDLIKENPNTEKVQYYQFQLAISYRKNNDYEKSVDIFNKILADETHKYHVQSFYELGMAYFYQKKWKEAIFNWMEYLKREKRRENIIQTKFMIANAYETNEQLKEAYDIYYSIVGEYPNSNVIKGRLKALYSRRMARKR